MPTVLRSLMKYSALSLAALLACAAAVVFPEMPAIVAEVATVPYCRLILPDFSSVTLAVLPPFWPQTGTPLYEMVMLSALSWRTETVPSLEGSRSP